jgi:hypothetical protein
MRCQVSLKPADLLTLASSDAFTTLYVGHDVQAGPYLFATPAELRQIAAHLVALAFTAESRGVGS